AASAIRSTTYRRTIYRPPPAGQGKPELLAGIPLDNSRYNEYYPCMTGKLAKEIRQTKPFGSPAEEAILNLHRTASVLAQLFAETLKPHGLTEVQYNALRILRGAGRAGLSCQEIADRMITHDPDITRLGDR